MVRPPAFLVGVESLEAGAACQGVRVRRRRCGCSISQGSRLRKCFPWLGTGCPFNRRLRKRECRAVAWVPGPAHHLPHCKPPPAADLCPLPLPTSVPFPGRTEEAAPVSARQDLLPEATAGAIHVHLLATVRENIGKGTQRNMDISGARRQQQMLRCHIRFHVSWG